MNDKSAGKQRPRLRGGARGLPAGRLSAGNAVLAQALERELLYIARELHDDIGASLGILGIEILKAGKPVTVLPGEDFPRIPAAYEKMQEIAKKISRLSHRLDPPALKYLGLEPAIKAECRVFSEDSQIPAVCSCHNVPSKFDRVLALSLLRALQEGLRNAAMHSGASTVEVEARGDEGFLTLRVRDNGRGFDLNQRPHGTGLGLIGIRERMRLVGGEFEIRSTPGHGAELICRVPISKAVPQATA